MIAAHLHPWPPDRRLAAGTRAYPGQGLVEYALILMLIAIVTIGVLTLLGVNVSGLYQSIDSGLTHARSS